MSLRSLRVAAALATLVAGLSCGGADGVAPPTSAGAITRPADAKLLAGLYASVAVPNENPLDHIVANSSVAANVQVSWVSLAPGTVPDGTSATIVNLRTARADTVAMLEGGFDPRPVPASLGDTILVSVSRAGTLELAAVTALGAKPGPRIVRTLPLGGQMDVPLDTIITLVFTEPLQPAGVNSGSFRLIAAGASVPGAVRIVPGAGNVVEFAPSASLAPLTTYALSVSGVTNLAGTSVAPPTSVTFTTTTPAVIDSVVSMTISPDSGAMNVAGVLQLSATLTLASGKVTTTPYPRVTWSSSVSDVASVDYRFGRVTGIAPGTAVITARDSGGVSATARVTVSLAPGPIGAVIASLCDDYGDCGMYAVDPDGSNGRFFTANYVDINPIWSPDGRWIAFQSQRECNRALERVCHNDLYVMRADGSGSVRSLTAGAGLEVGSVSWSPDGSRLVFAASVFPTNLITPIEALYVVNADGSGLQRILSAPAGGSASWPDWSPDGSRIAYNVVLPGAQAAINVVNADGTNDVRLSTPSASYGDHHPRWSPDGRRIALMRKFAASFFSSQVFVMDADGSNVMQITHEPQWAGYPVWSPDGSKIALNSGTFGTLGIIDADGTGGRAIAMCCVSDFGTVFSWRRTAAVPASAQSRATP